MANKKQTMANKAYLKHEKSAANQSVTALQLFFVLSIFYNLLSNTKSDVF